MANIKTHLNNIKGALYGKDVRGSIYNGIDAINKEVENTTGRQVDLENTFDQLVINAGNSNAEIVDARVKSDGTSYSKLGDRLNEVDSQLAHIENIVENRLNVRFFNVFGDGTDETEKIKQAFEFCKDKGYTVFFPKGTYLVSETITLQTSVIGKDATIYCNDIRVEKDNILIENLDLVSNLKTNGDDMYNSVE